MRLSFLFIGLISLSCLAQEKFEINKATSALEKFYTEYSREFANVPSRQNVMDSLVETFCSQRLSNEIKHRKENGMDYDLFLQGQDWDSKWTETILIRQDAHKRNVFVVSFYVWCASMKRCWSNIRVQVIFVKGRYLIDGVIEEPEKEK